MRKISVYEAIGEALCHDMTAIRESGARLVTQGAPMQPGNMFTLAYMGDIWTVPYNAVFTDCLQGANQ